jgi:hypothetical protein
MDGGRVALALARDTTWLLAAVVDRGGQLERPGCRPFLAMEVAILPDAVPPRRQTRAFAWLNVAGFLPAALGALAAGQWIRMATASGPPSRTRCGACVGVRRGRGGAGPRVRRL